MKFFSGEPHFPFKFSEMMNVFQVDDIITYIINEINQKDASCETFLITAISFDDLNLCTKLIQNGADPDLPSEQDALICAIYSKGENSYSIFEMMLPFSKKGVWYVPRATGGTLLQEAVCEKRLDIVKLLFQNGAELSNMDIDANPVWAYAMDIGGELYLTELEKLLPTNSSWKRPINLNLKLKNTLYGD